MEDDEGTINKARRERPITKRTSQVQRHDLYTISPRCEIYSEKKSDLTLCS